MVEHHIEDYLYTGLMQCLDHVFEFSHLVAVFIVTSVGSFGGAEGDRAVTPEIQKFLTAYRIYIGVFIFIEFGYGHQFHSRDAQLQQVGYFFNYTGKGAGMLYIGTGMLRKPPDMHLVDDRVLQGDLQGPVILPVKMVVNYKAAPPE